MLLVSDIHGAFDALAEVALAGEPLLILGDFLNFLDYRTLEGMVTDELGRDFAAEVARFRAKGDYQGSRALWGEAIATSSVDLRQAFWARAARQYEEAAVALDDVTGFATFGNVDLPEMLERALPEGMRFIDAGVVDVEGYVVGLVGGATVSAFMGGARVSEDDMAARLDSLGPVDILCTHVPPAIDPLRTDVVTGRRERASEAIVDYLHEYRPAYHYFGDVHQPQASSWRVGATVCRNVGYFRATRRAIRHP